MKKTLTTLLMISTVILAGCGTSSSNIIQVDNFSFELPTTYQSVSAGSLDQAQIAHTIIAAWKGGTDNLILSESSLPSSITLQNFTQETQSNLGQDMVGYTNGKVSSTSFTCNGTKIAAYEHTFQQTALEDAKKIVMYYEQLYFLYNKNVYILSLAHQDEKSIFSDIIDSFGCIQKQ